MKEMKADVAIVGCGGAGAVAAIESHDAGASVVVLEKMEAGGGTTQALVLDPAASYPWTSDDPRLSASGIMGDPRGASAAHGEILIARVVEGAGPVMRQLKRNAATKKRD